MINCYKDLKVIQIVIFAVLSIILLEVTSQTSAVLPLYVLICIFAAYIALNYLIAVLFALIAQKRLKRITAIMTEECDPYKFIEQILPLAQRKNRQYAKTLLLTNLAAGYINADDMVQAKTVLSDIAKIGTNNPILRANICNLWVVIFLNENNISNIPSALADLLKYSNQIKQKNLKYTVLCLYNSLTALYNLLLGKTNGAEQVFKLQLENSTHLLDKNISHYNLALLYIKQNRIEEAKQALQYVDENGNKLYIATIARKKLAEL